MKGGEGVWIAKKQKKSYFQTENSADTTVQMAVFTGTPTSVTEMVASIATGTASITIRRSGRVAFRSNGNAWHSHSH